ARAVEAQSADRDASELRIQTRRATGRRPRLRCAVPAESALRARAQTAHGEGSAGRALHGAARDDRAVRCEVDGYVALPRTAVRERGEGISDDCDWLHGRQAPVGDAGRDAAA